MRNAVLRSMAIAMGIFGFSAAALAQSATPGGLTITVENTTAKADSVAGKVRTSKSARPGDRLHYVLTFTNTTPRPIRGVTLQDPLPRGLRFVEGSEKASRSDMAVTYSVDGKTFVAIPTEEVQIEGRTVVRPVPADRYQAVRWVESSLLAPNTSITAEFVAKLPASSNQVSSVTP